MHKTKKISGRSLIARRVKRLWTPVGMPLRALTRQPKFGKYYLAVALPILSITTIFWSLLGARLQQANADQLVNPYLFEHSETFRQALIPATHTFLLKWPLFVLIKLFGFSAASFAVFTVACVLLTVACLVAGLALFERRPLVLGTLCLALASVLLLIPAQPHVGNLLPVNMAMITTRNLEYALYIGSLALLAKRPHLRSWMFWAGVGGLTLLIASDKLFLSLTLGGALLALIAYALASGWNLVKLSVRWLIGGLVATALASVVLWFIGAHHLIHITQQNQAGPYGMLRSSHQLALGVGYGLVGILTNLGANPAFETTVFRQMPAAAYHHLLSLAGPAFIINFLILLSGLYAMWQLLRHSFEHNKNKSPTFGPANRLAITLAWSALAAGGVFVLSSHYYAGDARYLTIWLFAAFISLAVYVRQRTWHPELLFAIGLVMVLSIVAATPTVLRANHQGQAAQTPFTTRNDTITQVLEQHRVDVLLGDYWRVIPTKYASHGRQDVLPLGGCTQPRDSLTSKAWQPDLKTHSFAYLLTLDGGPADYPACSLQQVVDRYGRPNTSVVLAGNLDHPREILLFYDHGINSSPSTPQPAQGPATVVPIGLDDLPYTICRVPTVMQVVAHEDDDLLFMNPDLIHEIRSGHCVRTIYLTAGDAGQNQFYWLGREQGSESAYSTMLGISPVWVERIVKLADNEYISVANPRGNSRISLIFMHLPDGNMKGQGFAASHFESLARLDAGQISALDAVYSNSTYTSDQLTDALTTLMHTYQPTEIRTQSNFVGTQFPDHSDHMAVGRFVKQAHQKYEQQQYENRVNIPVHYYTGYPIHQFPANVVGEDLAAKQAAFMEYAHFDGGVCRSFLACVNDPAYGAYLPRQYEMPY